MLSSCGQGLTIKVHNKTGFDVDSLIVGEKNVGFLKHNHVIVTKDCKEIDMQGGYPVGPTLGVIKCKQRDNSPFEICGTGLKQIKEGYFEFDLIIDQQKEGYRLFFYKSQVKSRSLLYSDTDFTN
jgi:hypothetical protein